MSLKFQSFKPVIAFIVLIALLSFAILTLKNKSDKELPTTKVTKEEKIKLFATETPTELQMTQYDSGQFGKALTSGTIADCENIKFDEVKKQQCYDSFNYNSALRSNDQKECEKLFNKEMKTKCFDSVYYSLGIENNDLNYCNKILDLGSKNDCSNKVILLLSKNNGTKDQCNLITDEILKGECLDNYQYKLSLDNLNADSCNSISSTEIKNECIRVVDNNTKAIQAIKAEEQNKVKSTTEILASCDQMDAESSTYCKDKANYSLAFEKKDISYCNKITDTQLKNECNSDQLANIDRYYLKQAMSTFGSQYCYKISNLELKAICLKSI